MPERFAVSVVRPPGFIPVAVFHEIAITLRDALRELGHDAVICDHTEEPDRRHIVLGAHLIPAFGLPAPPLGAVLFNTEVCGSPHLSPPVLGLYRAHRVWDYDPTNTARLRALGLPNIRTVPIGSVPALAGLEQPDCAQDFGILKSPNAKLEDEPDVVLFGSTNPRREAVIEALCRRGIDARLYFGCYGAQRDALMRRAKVVLNIHFYEPGVFEAARVSYALALGCFVLSESSEHAQWQGGYVAEPYDRIVDACEHYLAHPEERACIATRGHELFMSDRMADRLGPALEDCETAAPALSAAPQDERAPLLSVLVPTMPGRFGTYAARMIAELERQAKGGPVEVLCLYDNVQRTTGAKRNELLRMAQGRFAAFVDDDDRIAPGYVEALLAAIRREPAASVIVFDVAYSANGGPSKHVTYGLECEHATTPHGFTRKPNHLMCWRTELARSVRFPDTTFGEDTCWAEAIALLVPLEAQARIGETLYFYDDRGASQRARERRAAPGAEV